MNQNFRIIKLTENYQSRPFHCGDTDLDNFLTEDALYYKQRLLAITYLIISENDTVAYFSVANDKIAIPESDKATWRKIKKRFPHSKHRGDYPAVKIGRLAVNQKYQHDHLGSDILNFIKKMFITENRTGCSFITVDALQGAVPFYLKNGFEYIRQEDKTNTTDRTTLLFFDLYSLVP
ncbi:GNAT family N-acetyltransferase [Parabacteroides acidifaciens]|uniref:GNAT family N-acetyltransferase n=1 Tax=Parabacteroides acidifaciens TaxID=2290935 RepID=A0A3D8HA65_9BACT|nr:GNAT family N-acetyltransferase [Parabacteroides acidifaciens]MBC8603386.1 GNAT family N-acetyltransferase [Parabacteroides acidifaciens]RDU47886.1 GNAT family N-acetyltransferase [Parabacteroides acidifaciens]